MKQRVNLGKAVLSTQSRVSVAVTKVKDVITASGHWARLTGLTANTAHGESRMNQESYVSTTKMIACLLWVAVSALILSAWVVLLIDFDYRTVALMLAATASTLAAAAAVAHIRSYTLTVTTLIRLTSGLSGPAEPTALHRVH